MTKPLSIPPTFLLIVLATFLVSLLAPKGMAMEMTTVQKLKEQASTQSEISDHCAQMTAGTNQQKESQASLSHHLKSSGSMDCCDECECLMASCTGFIGLALLGESSAVNFSSQSFRKLSSVYLEPIQSFFKPPKIV